eukprot:COSAG01_NODE_59464_length_300_cov_0.756219_1_plen_27_part_10
MTETNFVKLSLLYCSTTWYISTAVLDL